MAQCVIEDRALLKTLNTLERIGGRPNSMKGWSVNLELIEGYEDLTPNTKKFTALLQSLLKKLGFHLKREDGIIDRSTLLAIQGFRKHYLKPTYDPTINPPPYSISNHGWKVLTTKCKELSLKKQSAIRIGRESEGVSEGVSERVSERVNKSENDNLSQSGFLPTTLEEGTIPPTPSPPSLFSFSPLSSSKRERLSSIYQACDHFSLTHPSHKAFILSMVAWHNNKLLSIHNWGRNGKLRSMDTDPYYGRGYLPLAGKVKYLYYQGVLGLPLEEEPDLALRPDVALYILVHGFREGVWSVSNPYREKGEMRHHALTEYVGEGLSTYSDFYQAAYHTYLSPINTNPDTYPTLRKKHAECVARLSLFYLNPLNLL